VHFGRESSFGDHLLGRAPSPSFLYVAACEEDGDAGARLGRARRCFALKLGFERRLETVEQQVALEAGDYRCLTAPGRDSYHTVWVRTSSTPHQPARRDPPAGGDRGTRALKALKRSR
jgi:hypothetical protein